MVSGSILMIEETVGRLRVSTCLYIFFIPSHFTDPEWVTLSFCLFQMSTGLTPDSVLVRDEDYTSLSGVCLNE